MGSGFNSSHYPGEENIYLPPTELQAEFVNAATDDLRLKADSRFGEGGIDAATNGKRRGADIEMVNSMIEGIDNGVSGE